MKVKSTYACTGEKHSTGSCSVDFEDVMHDPYRTYAYWHSLLEEMSGDYL